jgi:hypothetical protein
MRDTMRAETLLSLFTSADRAAAIAGDLTEAQGNRGPIWFWLDVVRVLPALWRRAVMVAPLRVIMLAMLGCILLLGPALIGFAAVALFPRSASPVTWLAFSFIWSTGALRTGAALVGIAPSRGMAACMMLAVGGETLLIALAVQAPALHLPNVPSVLSNMIALLVPALVVLGGAMARRRMIVRNTQPLE